MEQSERRTFDHRSSKLRGHMVDTLLFFSLGAFLGGSQLYVVEGVMNRSLFLENNEAISAGDLVFNGKIVQPSNFDKERSYFQEVDSFELLEESPSPKKSDTWAMGVKTENIVITHVSSVLQKWLLRRRLNHSCGPSGSLSKILGTPTLLKGVPCDEPSSLRTPEKGSAQIHSGIHPIQERFNSSFTDIDVFERCIPSRKNSEEHRNMGTEGCEDIEVAVRNLSLASRPSLSGHLRESFLALLTVCGQSAPSTLLDVFSSYCGPESIAKVGEGTFGEAFKAGKTVCKVVPFDGDLRVNGEVQKRAEELFEEVILSLTLNHLRGHDGDTCNCEVMSRPL